ncbi:MAG: NADH-quinone oxidoreductase subunit NuoH [Propionibacteriaceae bacterium]|jgi:NADH-quinone oxidoreductase subunit H|nr:NADH-quinone oxidoreductase subunit NuoH [Propionibacteriaceae bacterium]
MYTPMNDSWYMVLTKVVLLFVTLLVWTIFNVWYERRLVGKMQHRLGPIMNGPLGLGQALADGMKLLIKEDFMPHMVDKVLFILAPMLAGTAAFTAWAMIPFGGEVKLWDPFAGQEITTRIQLTDMPVGTLMILAVTSVGIYGFVLAGWSSNSPYSLLGGLRSSAQMISYEIAMGLSFVAVFLFTSSMSTYQIVEAQRNGFLPFGLNIGWQSWNWLILLPSFAVYVISMVGETNRAPFDLPEAESELVSGYITEYSGFRYAIYFLAEYINMATVSAIATTLFMGGYLPIWPLNLIPGADNPWLGPLWFIVKVQLFISLFVWLRGTLPRFRYDQFMTLGWKGLIPVSLAWIAIFSTIRKLQEQKVIDATVQLAIFAAVGVLIVVLVVLMILPEKPPQVEVPEPEPFDAFAGGYPVPPMPGQALAAAVVVAGASAEVGEPESDKPEAEASAVEEA